MGTVSPLRSKPSARAASPRGFEPEASRQPVRSLLRPGWNCTSVARAERVALLVDGDAYFNAFYRAALNARRSITILAWDFNSQTQLHFREPQRGDPPALLGEFLNWLARRNRHLHVNILDWDYPMVFGTDREFRPIYGFGWRPHRRVQMRYDDTHPFAGCQHQKIVLIDDQLAFVGGLDLTARRWDTPAHRPGDPHRVYADKPYPPFHDLMIAVDGDAARELAKIAAERWRQATGETLRPVPSVPDPWPDGLEAQLHGVDVGISRTMPARAERPAVREIEHLYLDMIRAARTTIYIENQYFTAPGLAAALAERLAERDGPEIVLVLRLLSHGWLEEHTMHVLRTNLIDQLRASDPHGRFHVYYPHCVGLDAGTCIDVHSKLMIVDESCLRIGSANLCNRSMSYDSECDIVIESLGNPKVETVIRDFRARLLAEHLAAEPAEVAREIERGGTLAGAIASLGCEQRCMRELEEEKWPETVVSVAAVADPQEPISLDSLFSEREERQPVRAKPAWGKLATIAGVIAALAAFWQFTPVAEWVNPESAIEWAKGLGRSPWAALLIVALYTPVAFTMFPRPLLNLATVIAFGPWLGFVLAMTGITSSAVATYYVGRRMRRDTVRRLGGEKMNDMVEVLRRHGLLAMTLLRLVPLAPFAVEGLVAGSVRLPMWQLALGTFLGNLPGCLAATLFANEIENAFSGSGHINWWVIGAILLVFAVGAFFVRRWFRRMQSSLPRHGAPPAQQSAARGR